VPVPSGQVILDTCGTGGDVRGTFNISTAAALIVAGAGVKVAKHGNRSASSKSGSADVLEKLGVKIDVPMERLPACLAAANLCFAFARSHHPAMKHVAAARSSLNIPTIFNLLGPLTNPARAKHQLLGVFAPELTDRLAQVLRELGSTRAWVVHGADGMDEISTLGHTKVSECRDGLLRTFFVHPSMFGLAKASIEDLRGGDAAHNADVAWSVLAGASGAARDIVLLNAGAGLFVAGRTPTVAQGVTMAAAAIDDGRAVETLAQLVALSHAVVEASA